LLIVNRANGTISVKGYIIKPGESRELNESDYDQDIRSLERLGIISVFHNTSTSTDIDIPVIPKRRRRRKSSVENDTVSETSDAEDNINESEES